MPSDASRGKQRQAEAGRYKQRQAETSRCNQRQAEASRGKQRQAEASTCFSASMLLGSVTRSFSSVRSRLWYHLMRPGTNAEHSDTSGVSITFLNPHIQSPLAITCIHVQSRAFTCNHVQSRAITCNPAPKVLDDPRHASARDLVASAKGATRRDDESLDDVGEGRLARETDDNGREATEG